MCNAQQPTRDSINQSNAPETAPSSVQSYEPQGYSFKSACKNGEERRRWQRRREEESASKGSSFSELMRLVLHCLVLVALARE